VSEILIFTLGYGRYLIHQQFINTQDVISMVI